MSKAMPPTAAFVARQAAFLQQQGLDPAAIDARLGAAFDAKEMAVLKARQRPWAGSFVGAFQRSVADLPVRAEALGLRGLALEQAIAEAYLGLWRGMLGFAVYAFGIAIVATLMLQILLIFVVPPLVALMAGNGGLPKFSSLMFEAGLGTALVMLMWLLAIWTLLSILAARSAILLRSRPGLFARIGLLRGVIWRHCALLHAWSAATLLDEGVTPDLALRRARSAVASWSGRADDPDAGDARLQQSAITLGTLRQELEYRIATELVDAPLALAARREWLALAAGFVAALLVAPLLAAMYMMIFRTAAQV